MLFCLRHSYGKYLTFGLFIGLNGLDCSPYFEIPLFSFTYCVSVNVDGGKCTKFWILNVLRDKISLRARPRCAATFSMSVSGKIAGAIFSAFR